MAHLFFCKQTSAELNRRWGLQRCQRSVVTWCPQSFSLAQSQAHRQQWHSFQSLKMMVLWNSGSLFSVLALHIREILQLASVHYNVSHTGIKIVYLNGLVLFFSCLSVKVRTQMNLKKNQATTHLLLWKALFHCGCWHNLRPGHKKPSRWVFETMIEKRRRWQTIFQKPLASVIVQNWSWRLPEENNDLLSLGA